MDVARAVEVLTGARTPQFKLESAFAVLAFSGWLNWPKEPYAPTNLVLLAISHALIAEQNKAGDLDEHAPLFSNILDVALRRSSLVRSRKVVLESVHGGSECGARRLRGGHHGRAKSASFRARHASSDSHW